MMTWHALDAASRSDPTTRVRFLVGGRAVGSVARRHLPALQALNDAIVEAEHAAPPFKVAADALDLCAPKAQRTAVLGHCNAALRAAGHIAAWRDETYAIVDPDSLEPLALIERAASRFWGTLTFGAHATGYVKGADGRPSHLWLARRSITKATDPGLFDNLIGGGVAYGQTPAEALVREAWEEAGLRATQLEAMVTGSVLRLARDIPHGFQHEWLHAFDVELPAGVVPVNQDGEVEDFTLLPVADALALAASDRMTVDAGLVTLDFALRHGLLAGDDLLQQRISPMRVIRFPEPHRQGA